MRSRRKAARIKSQERKAGVEEDDFLMSHVGVGSLYMVVDQGKARGVHSSRKAGGSSRSDSMPKGPPTKNGATFHPYRTFFLPRLRGLDDDWIVSKYSDARSRNDEAHSQPCRGLRVLILSLMMLHTTTKQLWRHP